MIRHSNESYPRFREFIVKAKNDCFALKEMGIGIKTQEDLQPYLIGEKYLDPHNHAAFLYLHYYDLDNTAKDRAFMTHAYKEIVDEIDYCRIDKTIDRQLFEAKHLKTLEETINEIKETSGFNLMEVTLNKTIPSDHRGKYYDENYSLLVGIKDTLCRWINELEKVKVYINTGDQQTAPSASPSTPVITKSQQICNQPYLAPAGILTKIHESFDGILWASINIQDFISCFYCREPARKLIISNKFLFVYLLTKFSEEIGGVKVNQKIANDFFGVKNFDNEAYKTRTDILRSSKLRKQINVVMNPPLLNITRYD